MYHIEFVNCRKSRHGALYINVIMCIRIVIIVYINTRYTYQGKQGFFFFCTPLQTNLNGTLPRQLSTKFGQVV